MRLKIVFAERKGFEPSIQFPVYTLSRRAPSTTRTPLYFPQGSAKVSLFYILNNFKALFAMISAIFSGSIPFDWDRACRI